MRMAARSRRVRRPRRGHLARRRLSRKAKFESFVFLFLVVTALLHQRDGRTEESLARLNRRSRDAPLFAVRET
jgi:hypothetical protein